DLFRDPITRRSFSGKDISPRDWRLNAVIDQAQVVMDNTHHVQKLALVFMNAFHLNVEHRFWIDAGGGRASHFAPKPLLVPSLTLHELVLKSGIASQLFNSAHLFEIGHPSFADRARQQRS